MGDYVTKAEDDNDQVLINIDYYYKATSNVPRTYREVPNSTKAHHWIEAMQEEMDTLKENNVFKLTTLIEGKNAMSSRWDNKIKENSDGSPR